MKANALVKWTVGLFLTAGLNAPSFAVNIIVNPGFETGSLAPWFQDRDFDPTKANWSVAGGVAHSGAFFATTGGNKEIRENLTATPTSSIDQVTLWVRHPQMGVSAALITFFYGDSTNSFALINTLSTAFEFFDVTSSLASGKSLIGFSMFGNTGGTTDLDDVTVNSTAVAGAVPEPFSLALLGIGLAGIAFSRRRT